MKQRFLLAMAMIALCLPAWGALRGDLNGDGIVDVTDVSLAIDIVLGKSNFNTAADLDGNGEVDVADVSLLIDVVLGKTVLDDDVPLGVYMGIIGFNDRLYSYPMALLNNSTQSGFTSFINSLTSGKGTVLYWATDNSLTMLDQAPTPADLSSVVLVTFTDGLDQGSLMYNDAYSTSDVYAVALNQRIGKTYKGLPLEAFCIGLRGSDVNDVTQFRTNLRQLSSSDANAVEVTDMNEVNSRLNDIAERLTQVTKKQDISLTIPGQSNGAKIRFTFDDVSDAANSSLYIEGTFRLSDRSLRSVTYHGMTSTSGVTVKGKQDGIFVTYQFTNTRNSSTSEILSTSYLQQWSYVSSSGKWQRNSEFTPDVDTEVNVTNSSALVVLNLDCSSSLGSQISTIKSYANNFVGKMAAIVQPPTVEPETKTYSVNGVSFTMVGVQGGTFTMGATSEQGSDAYDWEYPAHQVTLSSYSIGATEVTQELWQAVMGSNPSYFSSNTGYSTNLQRPVENVTWNDCQTFITKLNQLTGKNFRLPTEAEWEYAARGGNKSEGYKYSGSNTLGDVAWYTSNSNSQTHAVATKAPNELGLYDMSGNVWEWCQDWYGSYSSSAQTNPTGPSSGSHRVRRGGCWYDGAWDCRVSNRSDYTPGSYFNNLGLRLAL